MRQTLFYIPAQLAGFPVFGFGLALCVLLIGTLLAAAWRFSKTKKLDEDVWSYLGLALVGGVVLGVVAPAVMEPQGFPIRGYGVCLLFAILAALGLVVHLGGKRGISADQVFSLCIWAVVSGILGARLFYVIQYHEKMIIFGPGGGLDVIATLISVVNIASGGLVVFGSILGGMLGSVIFMIRNRMPVLPTFDAMAPAMMLGLAIGRIGCFLNGCCFGGVTDACCGVVFPEGSPPHIHQVIHGETWYDGLKFKEEKHGNTTRVRIADIQPGGKAEEAKMPKDVTLHRIGGMIVHKIEWRKIETTADAINAIYELHRRARPGDDLRFDVYMHDGDTETKPFYVGYTPTVVRPVHPTQLYSSAAAVCVCLILLGLGRLDSFRKRDGAVLAAFLLLYPVVRFHLEMIRNDEGSFMGTGLTISQVVSIGVFVAGCLLAVYVARRPTLSPVDHSGADPEHEKP